MAGIVLDKETQDFINATASQAFWDRFADLGWDLYFVLFGVGAALFILSVILPDDQTSLTGAPQSLWRRICAGRRQWGLLGVVLLLFLCAASHQTVLDRKRGFIADQDKRYEAEIKKLSAGKDKDAALKAQYLYMPEGNSLAYLSLGNISLAADYVWLTSFQYVSNSFRRGRKFEMLYRFYTTMLDLDPHWVEFEVNAGKVLSALEPDRFKVEKFYQLAAIQNPDNDDIPYEAGRLFVVPPLDPSQQELYSRRAVQWFNESLRKLEKRPRDPKRDRTRRDIEHQVARLSLESGPEYFAVADELLMKQVLDSTLPEALRSAAARGWLTAHSLFLGSKLEEFIQAYKKNSGQYPSTLDDLYAHLEQADKFKRDAYGFPFQYDSTTGKVSSKGVKARRTIQSAAVLNSLITTFRGTFNDTTPRNMTEFQDYIRGIYKNTPAGSAITDALGADLNTTISPMGEPWNYDAKAGRVIPPPESNPDTLFKNADELLKEVMAGQAK